MKIMLLLVSLVVSAVQAMEIQQKKEEPSTTLHDLQNHFKDVEWHEFITQENEPLPGEKGIRKIPDPIKEMIFEYVQPKNEYELTENFDRKNGPQGPITYTTGTNRRSDSYIFFYNGHWFHNLNTFGYNYRLAPHYSQANINNYFVIENTVYRITKESSTVILEKKFEKLLNIHPTHNTLIEFSCGREKNAEIDIFILNKKEEWEKQQSANFVQEKINEWLQKKEKNEFYLRYADFVGNSEDLITFSLCNPNDYTTKDYTTWRKLFIYVADLKSKKIKCVRSKFAPDTVTATFNISPYKLSKVVSRAYLPLQLEERALIADSAHADKNDALAEKIDHYAQILFMLPKEMQKRFQTLSFKNKKAISEIVKKAQELELSNPIFKMRQSVKKRQFDLNTNSYQKIKTNVVPVENNNEINTVMNELIKSLEMAKQKEKTTKDELD